jgi:AcrR family transcriptional regulator
MSRTVDPERYRQRREAILREAYQQFALVGFDRTTTASICRAAGISSGTFFHYFPTKLDALVGVLAAGVESTRVQLDRISREHQGLAAIVRFSTELERDMDDEHFGGFVHAIAGVSRLPAVSAALQDEADLTENFLRTHIRAAASQGEIRSDIPVESLAVWTRWLLDGAAESAVDKQIRPGELPRALEALLATMT